MMLCSRLGGKGTSEHLFLEYIIFTKTIFVRYTLYTLLTAALLVSGCKKEKEEGIRPFSIKNEASYAVTVDFYNNMEDYGNNMNVAFSRRVEGGQSVKIPPEVTGLNKDNFGTRKYYYDAYSDDYHSTPWPSIKNGTNMGTIRPEIFGVLTVGDMGYDIKFRKIFLDNTKTRTTWKAVDAVDYISHVSVWGQFSEDQKYLRMTFNKQQEATIEKKVSGIPMITDHTFDIYDYSSTEFTVELFDARGSSYGEGTLHNHNASTDTLQYNPLGSSMYILVKEH